MMALDESHKLEMENIMNLAMSVRAGFFSKEDWEAFLKEIQAS